jgi:hypothetical protein
VGSRNTSKDQNNSSMHCGSLDSFVVPDLKDDHSSSTCKLTEVFNNHSKPMTSLIQGRENDEHMAPNLVASIECQENCNDSRSLLVICHNIPFNLVLSPLTENIIKNMTNWVVSSARCGEDQLAQGEGSKLVQIAKFTWESRPTSPIRNPGEVDLKTDV